jgi:hypothetical protein
VKNFISPAHSRPVCVCVYIINSVPPPAKCVFFYIRMAGGRILSNTVLIINTGAKERWFEGDKEKDMRLRAFMGLSNVFRAFLDRKSAGVNIDRTVNAVGIGILYICLHSFESFRNKYKRWFAKSHKYKSGKLFLCDCLLCLFPWFSEFQNLKTGIWSQKTPNSKLVNNCKKGLQGTWPIAKKNSDRALDYQIG